MRSLSRIDIADAAVEENAMLFVEPTDEGLIVYATRMVEQIFGYYPGALEGEALDILIPEENRQAHKEARKSFHAESNTRAMGAGRPFRVRRKDGSQVSVVIRISQRKIRGETYDIATMIEVAHDPRAGSCPAGRADTLA